VVISEDQEAAKQLELEHVELTTELNEKLTTAAANLEE
jgi:hypothetical protein